MTAAPDGSVYVADWYDSAVGGHAFRDQTTGRIYRVAPKGAQPEEPGEPLRRMVTLDRIRLTGLLPESPANAGLSHFRECSRASPVHHGNDCRRLATA